MRPMPTKWPAPRADCWRCRDGRLRPGTWQQVVLINHDVLRELGVAQSDAQRDAQRPQRTWANDKNRRCSNGCWSDAAPRPTDTFEGPARDVSTACRAINHEAYAQP